MDYVCSTIFYNGLLIYMFLFLVSFVCLFERQKTGLRGDIDI